MWVKVTRLYSMLCDPMDCSPPGSSVHGILQTRVLCPVTILFSRGSSWPRDHNWVCSIAGGFFSFSATWKALYAVCVCANSLQLCPTLYDPMNYSLPGSSVHVILQARILELVAMPSSRASAHHRDRNHFCLLHCQASSLPLAPPSKHCMLYTPLLLHHVLRQYLSVLLPWVFS